MKTNNMASEAVFKYFGEICMIPHGSGNEKTLSDYLVSFAKKRNLWVYQDEDLNVIIKKPGTIGYENSPAVILQAHFDMVCEKNVGTKHNFLTDPIKLITEDDYIKADGTTLGADNGIGVAMMLATLDAETLEHPPIEALFTSGEEVGLLGATSFDATKLEGKMLVNMDTEEEGVFITSCAGGLRAQIIFKKECANIPEGFVSYKLSLGGLLGGHSGAEIHKERMNANRLFARTLNTLIHEDNIYLIEINGGAQDNAIPRECEAIIAIKKDSVQKISDKIFELEKIYKNELRVNEATISLTFKNYGETADEALSDNCFREVLTMILLLPNGIQFKSLDIEDLIETSNNVGVIRTTETEIVITCAVRSSVKTRKTFVLQQIELLSKMLGAKVQTAGDYPGWEYMENSHIRDVFAQTYLDIHGEKPMVTALHAGLECGVLSEKIEGLDIVSFGPNIFGVHTPQERASISSIDRTWKFFVKALANLS